MECQCIKNRIEGADLSKKEIEEIIKDIVSLGLYKNRKEAKIKVSKSMKPGVFNELTVGKEYHGLIIDNDTYIIINDFKQSKEYPAELFKLSKQPKWLIDHRLKMGWCN